MRTLAQLPGVAREKRQELMTPCTTQQVLAAQCQCNDIFVPQKSRTTAGFRKRSVDDHITMVETRTTLLTLASNDYFEL